MKILILVISFLFSFGCSEPYIPEVNHETCANKEQVGKKITDENILKQFYRSCLIGGGGGRGYIQIDPDLKLND